MGSGWAAPVRLCRDGALRALENVELVARDVTGAVIACFYRVYDGLGCGFLESVYKRAMPHELGKAGRHLRTEAPVDVWYDGIRMGRFREALVRRGTS